MKNIQEPLQILMLNLPEHFLAFFVQIFPTIKVLILFLFRLLLLFHLLHFSILFFVQTQNVVEISVIYIRCCLFLGTILQELDVNLGALF